MQHQQTRRTTKPSASLRKGYSQNGEEQIILEYFSRMKLAGHVLDIGANDGITFSNSYALIKNKGWFATLVEPSPKAFLRLTELHKGNKRVQSLQLAVAEIDEKDATMKESGSLLDGNDVALVSSFLASERARWESLNIQFEDVPVEIVSVPTLLGRCLRSQYHFVSIDIEGYEPVVVPQFDFNALGTLMVCIEWNGNNKELFDRHMTGQGYRLIHTNAENLIYAK